MTLRVQIRRKAWRIALAGWLIGWFVNTVENTRLFLAGLETPITEHWLFPEAMRNPGVALGMFVLALGGGAGFGVADVRVLRGLAVGLVLCALGLLGHIASYNDASYAAAFWSALWLVWWARRIEDGNVGVERHAIALGQGIVGLCFLGGVIGKLTPDYWNGEAFYQLYVVQKPYFPFDWMRANWSDETLRACSGWFARGVIVSEGLLATLILWPPRWALVMTTSAFLGMIGLAGVQLLSVLAPLAGLVLAGRYLEGKSADGENAERGAGK